MDLNKPASLKELASIIDCEYEGEEDHTISGLNEIHKVRPGDLTFVDVERYYKKVLHSDATTILINKKIEAPEGKALIFSDDPFHDYNRLVKHFYKEPQNPIGGQYYVSPEAKVGSNVLIYPGVFVGAETEIGDNTILYPNVVVYPYSYIGENCVIHANTTIGADAFYFKKREDHFEKLITCGKVFIENDVEIGAGCTIDRGVSGNTVIGAHSKLDAQIHIAHGVECGRRNLYAAQTGIAGKTILGDDVTLLGKVGIIKSLKIADNTTVISGGSIVKNTEEGKTYYGSPAKEKLVTMREEAAVKNLPKFMKEMEERLKKLEAKNS